MLARMSATSRVLSLTGGWCVGLALLCGASAQAAEYAPVDRPGPALSVPAGEMEARLQCSAGPLGDGSAGPVLLLQGTGATAKDNWSWTYQPALDRLGIPWCAMDLPDQATSDVQIAGEHVVYALRVMAQRSGRKVSIIGHSQGGMVGRWALRWWPDTRNLVEDLIGFAPSNHGTTQAQCSAEDPCGAAGWQQRDEADFIAALNSRQETFAPISYTSIYTRVDQTVQPNQDAQTGSSSLRTGDGRRTNVATQDLCPAAAYEHLLIGLVDPVAYALAVDALTHDGPADPARVSPAVCLEVLHAGINPLTAAADGAAAAASFAAYSARTLPAEPPLACYVFAAGCGSGAGSGQDGVKPATLVKPSCQSRRRFDATFPALRRGARATLNGRKLGLRRLKDGRLRATVDLRKRPRQTVTLRVRGKDRRGRSITVVRRYRTCA